MTDALTTIFLTFMSIHPFTRMLTFNLLLIRLFTRVHVVYIAYLSLPSLILSVIYLFDLSYLRPCDFSLRAA